MAPAAAAPAMQSAAASPMPSPAAALSDKTTLIAAFRRLNSMGDAGLAGNYTLHVVFFRSVPNVCMGIITIADITRSRQERAQPYAVRGSFDR